jgi:hypothetical protein
MEILKRRNIVKFLSLLLLRRSATGFWVDHPKARKSSPNHCFFGATKSKYKINRKFYASRRIREHVFYSLVRHRADPLKITKKNQFNQNFTKWLNILSSTVVLRLILEFILLFRRFLSITIKFRVRPPPRPFGVTSGATTRFLSCNLIRQTKTPKTRSFYNA